MNKNKTASIERILNAKKHSESYISKPKNIGKFGLIAIYKADIRPKKEQDIMNPKYLSNILAIHRPTNRILTYVTAETANGITEFSKNYPDAEIKLTAELDDGEDWELLAFPEEPLPSSATPLDYYFHGHAKDAEEQELRKLKKSAK